MPLGLVPGSAPLRDEPQRQMRLAVRRSEPENLFERLSRVAVPARLEQDEPEVEQERNRLGMLGAKVARHRLGLVELAQMEERDREIEQDFGVARAERPRFRKLAARGLVILAGHFLMGGGQGREGKPVVGSKRGSEDTSRLWAQHGRDA